MAGNLTDKLTYGTFESKLVEMRTHAKSIGGTVIKDCTGGIHELDKNGKTVASLWTFSSNKDGEPDEVRYCDSEGRLYLGINSGRKFTEIYATDGIHVATDKNGNGKVDNNEIQTRLDVAF